MAEPEEKGPLEKPIAWFSGWKASFERIRRRFGIPVAVLLTLSVAGGLVELGRHREPSRGRVDSRMLQPERAPHRAGRAPRHRGRASRADQDRENERLVRDGLREFEGAEVLRPDRRVDLDQPDEKKAEEEARGLLRQTGADVLIWGSVISLSGKSASAMRLFWTPARDVPGAKSNGKYQTETIELPPVFWSDLKQILGLLVQSKIAAHTVDQP